MFHCLLSKRETVQIKINYYLKRPYAVNVVIIQIKINYYLKRPYAVNVVIKAK